MNTRARVVRASRPYRDTQPLRGLRARTADGGLARPGSVVGAFTLIELLVVVAIIALLISILLPSLSAARQQARAVKCLSNARSIAVGFVVYATDHKDSLPGSTNDFIDRTTGSQPGGHPGHPVDYDRYTPMDWLGTIGATGDRTDLVPSRGTIFPYVGESEAIYKCPEDLLDDIKVGDFGDSYRNETKYSYTAHSMLTGASIEMFRSQRWAVDFDGSQTWNTLNQAMDSSGPWLFVEEDEANALAFVTDSAWGNIDGLTDRHQKRALIAYMDRHADMREFQRQPERQTAWRVYVEMHNGRIITLGRHTDTRGQPIRFGYLRSRWVAGIVTN